MSQTPSNKYTYADAGFNNFLSRSLKSIPVAQTLSDGASTSSGRAVNFDRQQVAAPIGNTMQVGLIQLNGQTGDIILPDGTNDRLLIGTKTGAF